MPSPRLEYAPTSQLPWHRRRKSQRRLIGLGLLVALAGGAWLGPRIWREARDAWLVRRCLSFNAPPGKVAFERDPERARAMIAADAQYHDELDRGVSSSPVASYGPTEWTALMRRIDDTAANFHAAPPVVLMHERATPAGLRRLVILRYAGTTGSEGGPNTHLFIVDLLDPNVKLALNQVRMYQSYELWISHHFSRLYYAAIDPADASHFSFRYETQEGAGTIDGWLVSDHELKLECRDGPEQVR